MAAKGANESCEFRRHLDRLKSGDGQDCGAQLSAAVLQAPDARRIGEALQALARRQRRGGVGSGGSLPSALLPPLP